MLRSYVILKGNRRKFCVFESANCGLGYEFDFFLLSLTPKEKNGIIIISIKTLSDDRRSGYGKQQWYEQCQ